MSWDRVGLRNRADTLREAVRAHVRSHRAYENYPTYGALLAAAVWLFGQLPVVTPMDFRFGTPALFLLSGTAFVGGSLLSFALGMVGLWRPGRASVILSILAMAFPYFPGR